MSAGNPDQAAQQVAARINQADPTLPPEALEKTDRTLVTTVPTTEQQKIEIDKQNDKKRICETIDSAGCRV